jgi:hypothetical protein
MCVTRRLFSGSKRKEIKRAQEESKAATRKGGAGLKTSRERDCLKRERII